MKTKLTYAECSLAVLFAFVSIGLAQSFCVGGEQRAGFARPHLHCSVNPMGRISYGPYSPYQIRHAYGVDQLPAASNGSGQKIAIVDAYGDPSIQTDLNNFCAHFNLPSTQVNIIYPQGIPTVKDSGWALETALDVEWAHAIAPGATILLSVAKSTSINDLLGAVDAAIKAGATVVSMSWGAPESSIDLSFNSHFTVPGVTFLASSGDSGEYATPDVEWPAVSPYVLAVGGTSLYLDANGNRISGHPETAWADGGGGESKYYLQPSYQGGWQAFGKRTTPDVSYVADPNTGILVVLGRYLYGVGGTSIGVPQWAGLIALSNQWRKSALGWGNPAVYSLAGPAPRINATYFIDITSGRDDDFSASTGFDLVTGLGTPRANYLVPYLHP